MRNDDAKTSFDQIGDVARRLNHGRVLVGHAHVPGVADERVAANGDDDGFHDARGPDRKELGGRLKLPRQVIVPLIWGFVAARWPKSRRSFDRR